MTISRILFQALSVALLAAAPMQAGAQLLSGNVDVNDDGASADVNVGGGDGVDANVDVDLGGGGSGADDSGTAVDADVSVGGGGADGGGIDADAGVSIGGGGGGTGGGGIDAGAGVSVGGGGAGGEGTGGEDLSSVDGGTVGGGVGGDGSTVDVSSDARAIILGNGQPAASLIGMIVYSSDGVALGVVQDIAGFDGTNLRLTMVPNSSLGLSQPVVMIDVPVSRLTQRELRLSITAAEFVRAVSA